MDIFIRTLKIHKTLHFLLLSSFGPKVYGLTLRSVLATVLRTFKDQLRLE